MNLALPPSAFAKPAPAAGSSKGARASTPLRSKEEAGPSQEKKVAQVQVQVQNAPEITAVQGLVPTLQ